MFSPFHHSRWLGRHHARGPRDDGRDAAGRDGYDGSDRRDRCRDGFGREAFAGRFGRHGGGPFGGRGGPGNGFGGGPGGGPGGDLGRFFAHGDLRLVILQLIAEEPRTGYDLIKAIETRVGGAYSPSPGTVYPTLTWLEESGFTTVSAGEGSRKEHAITPEGRAFLDANRRAVDALFARMDEAGSAGGVPAPVLRAMENLRFALRLRLRGAQPSPEQVQAIAAALDAAAQAVERS